MKRDTLIRFIKENDPFYHHASLSGYSNDQLLEVRNRIFTELKKPKCLVCHGCGYVVGIECSMCAGMGIKVF